MKKSIQKISCVDSTAFVMEFHVLYATSEG